MSRSLAMRRIILPQALRVIIPPAGNQFISLLKATSLVSVIAGGDLLTAAENISSANLKTIELMLVATFWYLAITTITSIGQYFIERRLAPRRHRDARAMSDAGTTSAARRRRWCAPRACTSATAATRC